MPSIRIVNFGGIKPKESRSNGEASRASVARNVNLEHGSLHPWRYPALEIDTGLDKVCSIYKHECCILTSDHPCASFTRGDTDCQRVFSTGVMPWPAYTVVQEGNNCCEDLCDVEWCRLGVPAPEITPEISGGFVLTDPIAGPVITQGNYDCTVKGNFKACDYLSEIDVENGTITEPPELDDYCDLQGFPTSTEWQSDAFEQKKREPRMYAYTFVNEFGEESEPSMPSLLEDMDYDSPAELSFTVPPMEGGYCDPIFIRIYRGVPTSPDFENPQTANNVELENYDINVNSTFLFVAEIPYVEGMITFLDDVPADCLGEACSSEYNTPPVECLQNIQVTETGSLVASDGKHLWFSEPFKFHAWNCNMNLDDCIINFKVARDAIFVATDGFPYIISAEETQDQECKCCRQVNKLLEPAPILSGCSMVLTNNGAMWATTTGLARMGQGGFQIDTHSHMGKDNWQEWYPHRIQGAWFEGKYFGFNGERGFIWDVNDGMYSETYLGDSGKFTELDLTPDAVYRSDNNELYMSFQGDIYKWNESDTYMPYTWRSKLHVEGGLRNYSIAKIVFEDWVRTKKSPNPATVRFYADCKLMFERQVNTSRPFRLPKGFDALNFEIEIQSIEPIMEFHMATSKLELTNLNNS